MIRRNDGNRYMRIQSFGQLCLFCIMVFTLQFPARAERAKPNEDVGALLDSVMAAVQSYGWCDKDDVYALRSQAATRDDPEIAALGVVNLMRLGLQNDVSLTWWRSKDPGVRKICLIMLIQRPVDTIILERERKEILDAISRFGEEEQKQRRREFEDVYSNGLKLWKKLENVLHAEKQAAGP